MLRRRPDLIVPIRDRRRHKRILTLKNFGVAVVSALIAFTAITIRSEMRDLRPGGYGRLFDRQVAPDVKQKSVEVVHEAPPPVDDTTHADPMLVQAAARGQWLQDETATATTPPAMTATGAPAAGSAEVAIVGGPEGVTVVRREERRPVLSGGFGRQ